MDTLAENFDTFYNAAKPVVAMLLAFAGAQVLASFPAVIAGITTAVTALQTAFWGLAGAEAAATGGMSAVAAAAGVAAIAAMAVGFGSMTNEGEGAATNIAAVGAAAERAAIPLKAFGKAASEIPTGIGVLKDPTRGFQGLLDDLKAKQEGERKEREKAEKAAAERNSIIWASDLAELMLQLRNRINAKKAAAAKEDELEDEREKDRKRRLDKRVADFEEEMANEMAIKQAQLTALTGFFTQITQDFGTTFEGVFANGLAGLREGLKGVLFTILAAIEQLLLAAKIKALAEAIIAAKFNLALSITAISQKLPAIIGLEALFVGLRAGITAFEHGGVIDRPTMALMGEAVHRSGPEVVAPRKGFKQELRSWLDDVALPVLTGGPASGELLAEIRGLRSDLAPSRFGRAAGRSMGRELAMAGRGRL